MGMTDGLTVLMAKVISRYPPRRSHGSGNPDKAESHQLQIASILDYHVDNLGCWLIDF